jgi:antitoxin CcdA
LSADLVKEAQAPGLNLAGVLDAALHEAVKAARGRRWVQENRAAFEAANRAIARCGIFNAEDREW